MCVHYHNASKRAALRRLKEASARRRRDEEHEFKHDIFFHGRKGSEYLLLLSHEADLQESFVDIFTHRHAKYCAQIVDEVVGPGKSPSTLWIDGH